MIASRSFREASIEEIFSYCKGTGAHSSLVAKWIPEWVKGLGIRLTAANFVHDWGYIEGATLKDKELADLHYFENLCSIIRWHGGSMMTIKKQWGQVLPFSLKSKDQTQAHYFILY